MYMTYSALAFYILFLIPSFTWKEVLEIIKNYLAYANRFSNPNTDRIKDYDIVIR